MLQCPEAAVEVVASVRASYPYVGGDEIELMANSGEIFVADVVEVDRTADDCLFGTEIFVEGESLTGTLFIRTLFTNGQDNYRHILGRGPTGEALIVDVFVDTTLATPVLIPGLLSGQRIIADTTLHGRAYQQVLEASFDVGSFLRRVYLTQQDGFLQFDYANGTQLVLNN